MEEMVLFVNCVIISMKIMKVNYNFDNKIVVVTGAAGQLGSALCKRFLLSNAKVVGVDIQEIKFTSDQDNFLFLKADVTNKSQIEGALHSIKSTYNDTPSILINNAAIDSPPGGTSKDNPSPESFPTREWNKILDVNLTGSLVPSQVFGAEMANKKYGSIINISSIYGLLSPDNRIYEYKNTEDSINKFYKPIAYSVSKSGIYNMTRYFATHWGDKNVRVNTVTLCGIFNNQDKVFLKNFTNKIPMQRMAECHEAVNPVIFLASDEASFMTGSDVVVDGGYTAW